MRANTVIQLWVSVACFACGANETVDYCVEKGKIADPPVGCHGNTLSLLATATSSVQRYNDQVAWSEQTIALDESDVYWSDVNGRVLRTPKRGGETAELLPASACSIADVVVDDSYAYFGQNCRIEGDDSGFPVRGRVVRIDKSGSGELELASFDRTEIRFLQVVDGSVYFMTDTVITSSVRVTSSDGTDSPGRAPLVTVSSPHLPFVVHGTDLYYGDNAKQRVERRPLAGGGAVTVAVTAEVVSDLQVIDGVLHWQLRDSAANSSVSYRASADGASGELALTGPCTDLLTGDELGYYGVGDIDPEASTALRVHRWLAPDYENELLAAGLNMPSGLAMDKARLYFTDLVWTDEPQKLRLMSVPR
jgi:hypothetical protein